MIVEYLVAMWGHSPVYSGAAFVAVGSPYDGVTQLRPSECVWMVPGTFDSNGDRVRL